MTALNGTIIHPLKIAESEFVRESETFLLNEIGEDSNIDGEHLVRSSV